MICFTYFFPKSNFSRAFSGKISYLKVQDSKLIYSSFLTFLNASGHCNRLMIRKCCRFILWGKYSQTSNFHISAFQWFSMQPKDYFAVVLMLVVSVNSNGNVLKISQVNNCFFRHSTWVSIAVFWYKDKHVKGNVYCRNFKRSILSSRIM